MCGFVPAEILVSSPTAGPGAAVFERVQSRLFDEHPDWREHDGSSESEPLSDDKWAAATYLDFRLLRAPTVRFQRWRVLRGQEQESIDAVNRLVLEESLELVAREPVLPDLLAPGQRVFAQPVHYLRPSHGGEYGSSEPVGLSQTHLTYLQLVGATTIQGTYGPAPTVAVIDGGFTTAFWPAGTASAVPAIVQRNVVAAADDAAAMHGTVVSALIVEVCPAAQLMPIRIFSDKGAGPSGVATEWALLAAMRHALDGGADIINLSMKFGLDDTECPSCGTLSRSVRSDAFELVAAHALASPDQVVLVAAAGNDRTGFLDFPARFGASVAVSSVNSLTEPSYFTNFDAKGAHPLLFCAPGGDRSSTCNEWVAESVDRRYRGTSFATAYASGVLAAAMSSYNISAPEAVNSWRSRANAAVSGYDRRYHGLGLVAV